MPDLLRAVPGAVALYVLTIAAAVVVCLITGHEFSMWPLRVPSRRDSQLGSKVDELARMVEQRNSCISFLASSMMDLGRALGSSPPDREAIVRLFRTPFSRLAGILAKDGKRYRRKVILFGKSAEPGKLAIHWAWGFDSSDAVQRRLRLPISKSIAGYAYRHESDQPIYVPNIDTPPRGVSYYRFADRVAKYKSTFCIGMDCGEDRVVLSVDAVEEDGLTLDDQDVIKLFAYFIQLVRRAAKTMETSPD